MSNRRRYLKQRGHPTTLLEVLVRERAALKNVSSRLSLFRSAFRIFGFLLAISVVAILVFATYSLVPESAKSSSFWFSSAEDVRTLVFVFASIGGALLAIIGIWLSHRRALAATKQSNVQQESHFTDLLVKSADQLAHENEMVRLVGINALLRLARYSPRDRPATVEILQQFLQRQLPKNLSRTAKTADATIDEQIQIEDRGDITSAVYALSEITSSFAEGRNKLPEFQGVTFPASLKLPPRISKWAFNECIIELGSRSNPMFEGCAIFKSEFVFLGAASIHFDNCMLINVDWPKEKPIQLTMRGGSLLNATFIDADLKRATFQRTLITHTRFVACNLIEADFHQAQIVSSAFIQSDMSDAYFETTRVGAGQLFQHCFYHEGHPPHLGGVKPEVDGIAFLQNDLRIERMRQMREFGLGDKFADERAQEILRANSHHADVSAEAPPA